ncbi:MAG: outer membrane protein assembly factor BamA [Opitutales bacterium]
MARLSAFLFASLLLCASSGLAQTDAGGSVPDPTIRELAITFDGARVVSEQYVRNNIQVKAGEAYDQAEVDQSIRTLYATRLFEFIEVKLDRVDDETVDVEFVVRPKFRIETIGITGNDRVSSRRLEREINIREGGFLDELSVKNDADKLEEYYLKKGFSNVDVEYEVRRDRVRGTATVVFNVNEGRKIIIKKIEFVGNEAVKDRRLRRVMKETKQWWWLSWVTGSGKFDEDKFREDLTALRNFYKNEGYLDIEIPENKIELNYPEPDELVIRIHLSEGQRYKVGEIDIVGNTIFTDEELRPFLDVRTGDVFAPEDIDEETTQISDFYGSRGYLDTRVQAERVPNLETRAIDLNFVVTESEKFFVESINIEGNTKTKSKVILRELALAPGDVFDTVRMKNSEARLKNTRFFEDQGGVTLTPEQTDIPGRRNLKITVREGRTGNLTFGAGFSSLERAVVFAEVTQGNFDLFNWRSFFQGDGQKFRLRLQLGSRSNEAILAFEEPWLFEQRLAFGFELFRRETDFNANTYNELRSGLEVYLRKRLFELVEGRFSYRYEIVNIFDVSPLAPTSIVNLAGPDGEFDQTVSRVGLTLLRDTRDTLIYTNRGNRIQLSAEYAGGPFQGDTDYVKTELRYAQFLPTFEFPVEQTLSLVGRIGTAVPLGDNDQNGRENSDDMPFFDRFFLGGPQSLRGFEFREVGEPETRDPTTGEMLGGNSYGLLSLEYSFKISDPLRFAVFYDAGFVNKPDFDFDPSSYNDNWGFGLRILVMGAPLSLDYGIPLKTDEFNEDDGAQFNFSFGSRF